MSEIKWTGLKDVVAWLECQPQWSGVAVRRVDEPPIPGEPFISMESAKLLIVSAVSIMDNRSFEAAARIKALEEALRPFADFDTEGFSSEMRAFDDDPNLTMGHFRRAARTYANKGEPT